MRFMVGIIYKIVIEIDGAILTYHGKIIDEDDDSVTFIDKFGSQLSYKKRLILASEEVRNGN